MSDELLPVTIFLRASTIAAIERLLRARAQELRLRHEGASL